MSIDPRRAPHPVQFEVEYPERLSRLLLFVKIFLIIPHVIVLYLLGLALGILTLLSWFAILFSGRYPKAFHEFTTGVMRWSVNVVTYVALLRDEYPPFSWEPGQYPAALTIPHAERQSRVRLFVRPFTIVPQYIVLYFVTAGWYFTTFIAWWAILITGRYPQGLFRFSVGVGRWYQRQYAYLLLMRDEYPPYSFRSEAPPGNEVVSGIIGFPIGVAYYWYYISFSLMPLIRGPKTVDVDAALLDTPGALERAAPNGSANGLRITLLAYDESAIVPSGASSDRPLGLEGAHLESFTVRAEQHGWTPAFYTPFLFDAVPCFGAAEIAWSPVFEENGLFNLWLFSGSTESTIYFWVEGASMCELRYSGLGRGIRFEFE